MLPWYTTRKSKVLEKLKEYISMVHNTFGKKTKNFRSDNGGEYINKEMKDFLREHSIQHELIVLYCPSQNNIAKRKNRTLLKMTKNMSSEASLLQRFCEEKIYTVIHL